MRETGAGRKTTACRGRGEIMGTNTLIQKKGLRGMAGGGTSEYRDEGSRAIRTTAVHV